VSNQTRKRRDGGVGGWVLAARLEKKGHIFSRAPEEEPAIPPYGAPNGQGQLGIPRGGGLNLELGTTPPPDQVGGRGLGDLWKIALSLVRWFF